MPNESQDALYNISPGGWPCVPVRHISCIIQYCTTHHPLFPYPCHSSFSALSSAISDCDCCFNWIQNLNTLPDGVLIRFNTARVLHPHRHPSDKRPATTKAAHPQWWWHHRHHRQRQQQRQQQQLWRIWFLSTQQSQRQHNWPDDDCKTKQECHSCCRSAVGGCSTTCRDEHKECTHRLSE